MKTPIILFLTTVLILAVGAAYLSFWEIPVPSVSVQKVLPNDKFLR